MCKGFVFFEKVGLLSEGIKKEFCLPDIIMLFRNALRNLSKTMMKYGPRQDRGDSAYILVRRSIEKDKILPLLKTIVRA